MAKAKNKNIASTGTLPGPRLADLKKGKQQKAVRPS